LSVIPLLCCGALLVAFHVYALRHTFAWARLGKVLVASITVPFIEEAFFRGMVLGVLLRTGRKYMAIVAVSAVFAGVGDLMTVTSAFATLFLFGCILAVARVDTHSLWLSIGLHAGLIFGSGALSWLTHRQIVALPW